MSRTRPLVVALSLLLVASAPVTAPMAASADASERGAADKAIAVPAQAWVTITGHGYGHGHGMSQYGAEGAARQGRTAQQIINFYYPGTTSAELTGYVRVHLTADTDNNTVVLARPGLQLRDQPVGGGPAQVWRLPDNGATKWRLVVGSTGDSVVAYAEDGSWHWWKRLVGDGGFSASGQPVTLVTPSGRVAYRGALRSVRPSPNSTKRDTVNVLPLDQYLKGVVPREMPASWHPAAVQAQAIAARTYAAYERAHPLSDTYQICDTTSCQVYGGYSSEHPLANAAIEATAGKIQTYAGEPAFTQFSASSGGWTSAGSVPYLTAKADPYDGWSGNSVHTWSVRVDATAIERQWPSIGNLEAIKVTARDGNGEWGGRIKTMVLVGARGKVTVTGDDFRSRMGLRSQWVSFKATAKSA